jgi:hypothetical protein
MYYYCVKQKNDVYKSIERTAHNNYVVFFRKDGNLLKQVCCTCLESAKKVKLED